MRERKPLCVGAYSTGQDLTPNTENVPLRNNTFQTNSSLNFQVFSICALKFFW